MTRERLLTVFTTEGGLSTGLRRTFVSRDCPYFKVDVEFEAVGRPGYDKDGRVTLVEDARDVIVRISNPNLSQLGSSGVKFVRIGSCEIVSRGAVVR